MAITFVTVGELVSRMPSAARIAARAAARIHHDPPGHPAAAGQRDTYAA